MGGGGVLQFPMALPFLTRPSECLTLIEVQKVLVGTQYPEPADGPVRVVIQQRPGHVVSETFLGVLGHAQSSCECCRPSQVLQCGDGVLVRRRIAAVVYLAIHNEKQCPPPGHVDPH
jgi:hypothetical protein